MTIDFRMAIDWQDNGHVNWLQNADSENDPLNELTSASLGGFTVTGGTLFNSSTLYGLDFLRTTTPNTTVFFALREIYVSSSTQYTVNYWTYKLSASDNSKRIQMIVYEYNSGGTNIATNVGGYETGNALTWTKHTTTFTTTSTTQTIGVVLYHNPSDTFVDNVRVSGLMVYEGSTVANKFNDGAIKVLTHRVIDARWNVGYKTSIINGSVANENRLECSLYNLDDYITEAKYGDVHRVYIEGSDDGGATWTRLYTGWTRTWHPIFDTNNPAEHLRFTGVSSRFYMDGIKARLPVQSSNAPLTIMIAIIGAAELPNGETITTGTPRPGETSYTISYAGQNWTEEVDLLRALADTAWGDGRWTYFDRDDEYHGYSVGVLNDTGATSDFTITYWLRGTADYRYADPWINMVEMRVSPRKLSATSAARLWELPASVTVANGASETILARFNDEDKPYQISARQVNIASQTWSAGTPTVTLSAKSTSAYIEITNSTGSSTTLTAMRLNGQKIKTWDSFYEQYQYDTEITTNGNNTLTIPSELPDSVSQSQLIMSDWLEVYGEKHNRLWSVVVPGNRGEDSDLLDYSIGNVCSIEYPDGSTYKHYLIGEEWAWRKNGHFEKKLYLERIYSNGLTPTKPTP